jgi:hypothetical protein
LCALTTCIHVVPTCNSELKMDFWSALLEDPDSSDNDDELYEGYFGFRDRMEQDLAEEAIQEEGEFELVINDEVWREDERPELAPIEEEVEEGFIPPAQSKHYHSIGTRILFLIRLNDGMLVPQAAKAIGMSRAAAYKLKAKAYERLWEIGMVAEPYHIDDKLRSGRPPISKALKLFIGSVITKNSTIRG